MRPAIEVMGEVLGETVLGNEERAAAVIQRDREELVREICAELMDQHERVRRKKAPVLNAGMLADLIERKYLKGSSDGR